MIIWELDDEKKLIDFKWLFVSSEIFCEFKRGSKRKCLRFYLNINRKVNLNIELTFQLKKYMW